MRGSRITASLIYIVVSIALFNIVPLDSIPGSYIMAVFAIYLFINVIYSFWRYVYIGVFIQSEKAKSISGMFSLYLDRFKRLKPLLISFLAVKFSVYTMFIFLINGLGLDYLYVPLIWFQSLSLLFLEYFYAPYLLLNRVARRVEGYSLTTILLAYSLPWAIMGIAVSAFINIPIMLMFGLQAMYPYYLCSRCSLLAAIVNSPIGPLIPTIGEMLVVVLIAYYTEAVTYGYV